jgi:hypothetical protein
MAKRENNGESGMKSGGENMAMANENINQANQ